jgi:hypothetical protein
VATTPLAQQSDVEAALLRPLTETETTYITKLIAQASALLRNSAPSVDDRIALFTADPTNPRGVSWDVVSAVVGGIIKRYMVNPKGLASTSDTTGPYNQGETFALRSEKDVRGLLEVTPEDLAILFPSRKRLKAGNIRLRPALAPRPVGRYGGYPTVAGGTAAVIDYSGDLPADGADVDPFSFREGY